MAMLVVNGTTLRSPSEMTWGLQDISAADAGRTEDGTMHKNRIAQKRKLSCGWQNIPPADAAAILTAVNSEYMSVTYFDAMDGGTETREMYVGDRSAPIKWWYGTNGRIYSKLTLNFIER